MRNIQPTHLSVEEVAHRLSLSIRFVWKLVASGELPSTKVGKRRLIAISDIYTFLEERKATPGQPVRAAVQTAPSSTH